MRRLTAQVEHLAEQNREMAAMTVKVADTLPEPPTAVQLQHVQDAIRKTLLWTEWRLGEVRSRVVPRSSKLRRFRGREDFRRVRETHIALLRRREELLARQRQILRQTGDVIAWKVLRRDPAIIAPLYTGHSHMLPEGIGLLGPVQLEMVAHNDGTLLILENDLTRALGVGDFTIVRADGKWRRPLSVEVKSSGEPKVGATVETRLTTVVTDEPGDAALFEELRRALGLLDADSTEAQPHTPQERRMLTKTQQAVRLAARTVVRIQPPATKLREVLARLASRAVSGGSAFETPEEGVGYIAASSEPLSTDSSRLNDLVRQLRSAGFGPECEYISSEDFQKLDWCAAFFSPIPLWPLDERLRRALLVGDLLIAVVYKPTVWRDAFAAAGLSLVERGGTWTISRGERNVFVAGFDSRRLSLGLAFAGVSPRGVAQGVATALDSGNASP